MKHVLVSGWDSSPMVRLHHGMRLGDLVIEDCRSFPSRSPHIHPCPMPKTEIASQPPLHQTQHWFARPADAPMRYVRFLKTPRIVTEKGTGRIQISCLITITSDLGDSFLAHDVQLSAELLTADPPEEIRIWQSVRWKSGMRSLPISFPANKNRNSSRLLLRVGVEPKSTVDEYTNLLEEESCSVVSAWSLGFSSSSPAVQVEKLVERRFKVGNGEIRILEETGESIARHLW